MTLSSYTETYTTFSGADIVCTFGGVTIGKLSGITWSVTREKAPIYTMGFANPRSFSRGKRGIAGSLIFTMFDRPSLYDMLAAPTTGASTEYWTRTSNVLPGFNKQNTATHAGIVPVDAGQAGNSGLTPQAIDVTKAYPYYNDQIPPFDVTITFANEYGQAAVRSIYGCEILNEGSGASMDDVVIEETMTFIARDLGPMVPMDITSNWSSTISGFTDLGNTLSPDITFDPSTIDNGVTGI